MHQGRDESDSDIVYEENPMHKQGQGGEISRRVRPSVFATMDEIPLEQFSEESDDDKEDFEAANGTL